MKTQIVSCKFCGAEVEKTKSEMVRSKKLGRPFFCNLSCAASFRNAKYTPEQRADWNLYNIAKHADNQLDGLSPFRYFVNKSRCSERIKLYGTPTISAEYLKQLWEQQKGCCAYTGVTLVLPGSTKEYSKIQSLKKASLDRIDSSKGYVEGNVEFVCYGINLAKNSFTREEMKEFLEEIRR